MAKVCPGSILFIFEIMKSSSSQSKNHHLYGKGSYTHGLYETILMTKVSHDQTFTYWHCRAQPQHNGLCQP
ncbi:hypothetical protein HK23_08670 [Acetobacter malorum]|uniref:Uncharacterized protein n=1 Tax=Acetobacter malorum TaxID=178901 RepID=A0A1Y3G3C6_9PROT|nr:hypothetical protein HK23_08670 [Acetobacter malorum]